MRKRKKLVESQIRAPVVKASGYSEGGASTQKDSLRAWRPQRLSAKSDIDANLELLRGRAADLATNTPIGAAATVTSVMRTVGVGLRLFPKVPYRTLGITPAQARDWGRAVAQEFNLWADSKDCDLYRRNNFYDLQSIAYAAYLTDGDSFVLFRRKAASFTPYSLRLQVLESNRISNPGVASFGVEARNPKNGNKIVNGIEVDKDGAMVAYWVCNKVPSDYSDLATAAEWTRVEAFGRRMGLPNMLQVCHDTRPEQYRGVPYLAPVIENLKQVGRYCNAELTSAIIRSFLSVFFTNTSPSNTVDNILPDPFAQGNDGADEPVADPARYHLGPGTLNSLPRGVDVKTVDSAQTQSVYDTYMTHLEKGIAAALNIPHEVLFKSFNSSYSSSRAALLQAQDEFKTRRHWFAADFCQPIYEQWLTEAIALGRIEAPGFFDDHVIRKAWCEADWYGPTMSILDPQRDVNGAALRILYGLSTREREAAEMTGSDLEDNLEQLAYEKSLIEGLGLSIGVPAVLAGKEEGGEEK